MHNFFARVEAAICEADGMNRPIAGQTNAPVDASDCGMAHRGSSPMAGAPRGAADRAPTDRGRVVLIEGMDLAGKSTLVRNLQTELASRGIPVRVSRNALCPDNPIAPVADQLRRDQGAGLVETGALFLTSHLWDARHFVPPPPGTIHIQDSCWLRTLAYHTVRGTPRIPDLLRRVMPTFPRFDAAVFLTAAIEERHRRLSEREHNQPGTNDANDHLVHTDPNEYMRQERLLCRLTRRYATAPKIDTTGLSAKLLVPLVVEALQIA